MIENHQKMLFSSLLLGALLLGGCGIDNTDKNVVGNNLIITADTFTPTLTLPKAALGADALAGIKSYKITYMTKDSRGNDVKASGLITLPDLSKEFFAAYKNNLIPGLDNPKKRDFTFSMVSDQHGTIFTDAEAPSNTTMTNISSNNPLAIGFAANALFMIIQPDYLGYGESNTTHPFIIEDALANTTVDMIKAAIEFANKAGIPINGQLFLSGYSEGGYATMAAAKEIQENHPDLHLMAVAPMAGPYDVEQMAISSLQAPMMSFPPFLAYIAEAYANRYDDVTITDVVNQPYASMLPTLFDGTHSGMEIYASLPNALDGNLSKLAPDQLFVPAYSDQIISDPDNPLRKRFAENSVIDWTPKMPMHLYHCSNDMIIPYTMSTLAMNHFEASGAKNVELVTIDTVESNLSNPLQVHANCAPVAYQRAITWFDQVRKGEK